MLRTRKSVIVHSWSKRGWKSSLANEEKLQGLSSVRTYLGCQDDNFEDTSPFNELKLFQEAQNEIQVGSVGLEIDKLPGPLRDMVQSPYDWHMVPGKLFRIVDPVTQAKVHGEVGTDVSDADIETIIDRPTATRMLLEASSPTNNELYFNDLPNLQEGDHEEEEEDEDDIAFKPGSTTSCVTLPDLPDEVKAKLSSLQLDFEANIKGVKEPELGRMALLHEYAVDQLVNKYITNSFNSPWCGYGYSTPRRRYTFIDIPRGTEASEAATDRVQFFYDIFGEAARCSSDYDLFGPLIINGDETTRPGGFYGKIRSMHSHDKKLATEWSIHNIVHKDGSITKSAFSIAREEFIHSWREDDTCDEESLRIAVWVQFDRLAGEVKAIYSDTGKLIKPRQKFKNSVWHQRRTKALQELFLTKPQWDSIYTQLKIVKDRLKLNNTSTDERIDTLDLLAKHFRRVTNLSDLRSYMNWAQKRKFGDKFKFSPRILDKASFIDEQKWRVSCAKKKRYLVSRLVQFNLLREQIQYTESTDMIERSIICPDHRCDSMAIGIPEFAAIEDSRGLLFIRCDGCGREVWMVEHKEEITLGTFEELVDECW